MSKLLERVEEIQRDAKKAVQGIEALWTVLASLERHIRDLDPCDTCVGVCNGRENECSRKMKYREVSDLLDDNLPEVTSLAVWTVSTQDHTSAAE